MMTSDQVKVVVGVYAHLIAAEDRGWDSLDDYMHHLEYLDDDQLHREADVILTEHVRGLVRCRENHPREKCFIPTLIEAVGAILELYKDTNNLHPKNRYILCYYLAFNQADLIIVDSVNP